MTNLSVQYDQSIETQLLTAKGFVESEELVNFLEQIPKQKIIINLLESNYVSNELLFWLQNYANAEKIVSVILDKDFFPNAQIQTINTKATNKYIYFCGHLLQARAWVAKF